MLEAVVEHVDGGVEPLLGQPARAVPVRADQHAGSGEPLGEHQRLVSGLRDAGADPSGSRTTTTPAGRTARP